MPGIKRCGNIIAVKPGMLERYIEFHRHQSDEIRDLLRAAGCVKCDIYAVDLGGTAYLFQSVEIDEAQRSVDLSRSEAYEEWARLTSECQSPILGADLWKEMDCVYTLDKAEGGEEG